MRIPPRMLPRFLLCFGLVLTAVSVSAQNKQVNKPDHNFPNLDNSTTGSETNHAVFGSTIVVGYNSSTQFASLGTNFNSLTGYAFSTDGEPRLRTLDF